MEDDWVEGEDAPREYVLKQDGVPWRDLTGFTITLEITDRTGAPVDMAGDVVPADPQTGSNLSKVVVTPDPADFTVAKEPLRVRFKVTDGANKHGYFPKGEPDIWRVYKP